MIIAAFKCLHFVWISWKRDPKEKFLSWAEEAISSCKVSHRRLGTEWKLRIVGLGASLTEGRSLCALFLDKLDRVIEEEFVHTTFMSLMKAMLLLKHLQVLSPETPPYVVWNWSFDLSGMRIPNASMVVVTVELTMILCKARRLGSVGRWSNSSICIYQKNTSWCWVNMKKFMNNSHNDQTLYLGYSGTLIFNSHLLRRTRFQDTITLWQIQMSRQSTPLWTVLLKGGWSCPSPNYMASLLYQLFLASDFSINTAKILWHYYFIYVFLPSW